MKNSVFGLLVLSTMNLISVHALANEENLPTLEQMSIQQLSNRSQYISHCQVNNKVDSI